MPGTYVWLAAFWELSTDRQIGMAAGPIPAASIDRWSDDMDAAEAEDFRHCIRLMDATFLDYASAPENERPKVESRPMTEELFDAIFG